MTGTDLVISAVQVWGLVGAVVALTFLTFGIDLIDADARGAYVFRVLLVPGILLIWPLALWRWYIYERGRDEWSKRHDPLRAAHFWVGVLLLLAILWVGLLQRQDWPADIQTEQLPAPGEVSQ